MYKWTKEILRHMALIIAKKELGSEIGKLYKKREKKEQVGNLVKNLRNYNSSKIGKITLFAQVTIAIDVNVFEHHQCESVIIQVKA